MVQSVEALNGLFGSVMSSKGSQRKERKVAIKYVFAEDAILAIPNAKTANPQKIGESLEKIRVNAGGELTPIDVVNAARSPKSALHDYFEWDDSVAAEQFRLNQARGVIRLVRVEDAASETGTVRAFVSISSETGKSYRSMGDVKASADLRAAVLAAAERDLDAFTRRYRELTDVLAFVEKAKETLRARRRRSAPVENRASA